MQLIVDTELSKPANWALDRLNQVFLSRSESVQERSTPESGHAILVGVADRSPLVDQALDTAGLQCPEASESLVIHRVDEDRLLVAGRDKRGLVYALLEVARAIELSTHDGSPLDGVHPAVESPALDWRSSSSFSATKSSNRNGFTAKTSGSHT